MSDTAPETSYESLLSEEIVKPLMSEQKHSSEPWMVEPDGISITHLTREKGDTVPMPQRRANAARIVACVNFCAGQSLDGLLPLTQILINSRKRCDENTMLEAHLEATKSQLSAAQAEIEKRAGQMVAMDAVEAGLRCELEERQDDIKIIAALNAKIEQLQGEVEGLRERLSELDQRRLLSWHNYGCKVFEDMEATHCTCGLSELLREKGVGK